MKVTLKLSAVSAAVVADGIDAWADEVDLSTNCEINRNQRLGLVGTLLTYTGERHPLQQDGALALIRAALAAESPHLHGDALLDSAVVHSYTTSDKRLKWHETLVDYLENRSTVAEASDLIASRILDGYSMDNIHERFASHAGICEVLRYLERGSACAHAALSLENLRAYGRISAALSREAA